MEGMHLPSKVYLHGAVNAAEVAQAHCYGRPVQYQAGITDWNDEVAGHDDIGSIDHDIVYRAVQGLSGNVDIVIKSPGIHRPDLLDRSSVLLIVKFFHIVGELEDRSGKGLGKAPAVGYFETAFGRRGLPVMDLALDHGKGNEK